ncbi:MAG: hypothetical protein COB02_02340 [Candidatus Cloacimonadota bacterium]|nr:MAG: hypothetical protein COB02_02340 [Candidatus Cloacimonadota bacterium]
MLDQLSDEKEVLASKNKEAEELLKDKNKTFDILEKAQNKSKKRKNRLQEVRDHISTLIRFVKACISGEYKNFVKTNMVLAMSAILYFLSPIDLVPDIIPTFGFLDDMAVIAFVISILKEELEAFCDWEKENKEDTSLKESLK